MSNPTLSELRSLVLGYLAEPRGSTNALYTDADINAELNNACREVITNLQSEVFMTSSTVDATSAWVVFPTNVLGELQFQLISSGREVILPIKTAFEMNRLSPKWRTETATYPTMIVTRFDSTLGLQYKPYPEVTGTLDDALYLSYKQSPAEVTLDAGTFALLAHFPTVQRTILPAGALKNLLLLEGGEADDQAAKWFSIWQRDLNTMQHALNRMIAR